MTDKHKKIIRSSTIPRSLSAFLSNSIETLMEKYELVLLSSPEKELSELRDKYGVKTVAVPMERHISLSKDLKSLIALVKVFHKEKPYLVHSMTPKAGLLCMIASWICRVPRRVHTFTGLVWPTASGLKRKILMATDWITCACATHIIPEGEGVKNDLQSHVTKKPMKVLGYGNVRGVDMNYWQVTPELRVKSLEIRDSWWLGNHKTNERLFTFLFVGRIVGDKGINELVEAFLKLREHYLNMNNGQKIRLLLVGRYEKELDAVSDLTQSRINSTPSIMAVGPKFGEELLSYYTASDCFVFPSYREGFPNTVIEAGAMGLPSIVTDINGSREIIIQGENGVIIPSKDVDAIYYSMKEMIDNKEKTAEMASKARGLIESRFEQDFVQKCLFDFYDEILK